MRKSQIRCCLTAFLLHAAALRKANWSSHLRRIPEGHIFHLTHCEVPKRHTATIQHIGYLTF
jgi:hypothetical protein